MNRLRALIMLAAAATAATFGQSAFPFTISSTQPSGVSNAVLNGGVIQLSATGPGQTAPVNVTFTYTGSANVEIPAAPQLIGSFAFTITSQPNFPLTLGPGAKATFEITYRAPRPVGTNQTSAQFSLQFVEVAGSNRTAGVAGFFVSGTAPEFALSYTLASNGNVTPLVSGSAFLFGETNVNSNADAQVSIVNRGSGPGAVNAISVTGDGFQALGLPLLPIPLGSGGEIRFLVRFSPKQTGPLTGTLELALGDGSNFVASLQGTGVSFALSYQLVVGDLVQNVVSLQTLQAPDTKLGERSRMDLVIRNSGTATGVVVLPSLSGEAFGVLDSPRFPLSLAPGESFTMTLVFVPTAPGTQTARLRINNDIFDLSGVGIGARLALSYVSSGSTVPVQLGSSIVFGQTTAGSSSSLTLTVENTGTSDATVTSIGVVDTRNQFQVASLPALPLVVPPGKSFTFAVTFSPVVTGLSTGSLLIDTAAFGLSGFGGTPPPLPAYRFSGVTQNLDAFQQPALSLTLNNSYPLALRGTLQLTQDSGALLSDPAIQWASGGVVVPFTIPANSTEAVFANGSKQIRFQTGSVAAGLTITPTFATSTGGLDLTPAASPTFTATIARSAPRLLSAQVSSRSANGFTLTITGYSTTRALTNLEFTLAATPDANLPESKITVNVAAIAASWYQNPSSQAFGGQFTATMPFFVRVSSGTLASPTDGLATVSITATNEAGTSTPLSINLQ